MAKLTEASRQQILSGWKLGISQNQLAKEYNVSPATINKLCKDVPQDNIEIVNSQIAINRALSQKSEYEVNSIHQEVNRQMIRENIIFGNAEKLAKKINKMTDEAKTTYDLKALAEANDKLAITLKVADRHAPKTEITNTNANQTNELNITYTRIERSNED